MKVKKKHLIYGVLGFILLAFLLFVATLEDESQSNDLEEIKLTPQVEAQYVNTVQDNLTFEDTIINSVADPIIKSFLPFIMMAMFMIIVSSIFRMR